MRIAIYARFSKDDADSESTEDQVLRLQRQVEAQGDEVAAVYVDDGHSAWQDKAQSRPRFQAMVSDAKEGKFDIVLSSGSAGSPETGTTLVCTKDTLKSWGSELSPSCNRWMKRPRQE